MSDQFLPAFMRPESLRLGAVGAVVSFVALMGVAAVSDAPRGLTDVSLKSESIRLAEPTIAAEQPAHEFHAVAPATGHSEDPGLQVTYDVPA
jgi:hypothetical protein